jgi:O-methyltransferase
VTLDTTDRWPTTGRRFWDRAGVAGVIETRIGPATDTLEELHRTHGRESFDMAFIDADTRSIRDFNEKVFKDPRVNMSLLPMADGITLARKT